MNEVPTHNKEGFPVVPCDRCCGRERMDEFLAVDAGRCFKCHGARVVVRPGKAAKQWKAYKEALAEAQKATVADLKEGDVFTNGDARCVTLWQKFVRIEEDKSELNRSNGYVVVVGSKGKVGTKLDYPVRIHRPGAVDVNEFLKGL
jgi:hypothetical protein